MYSSPMVSVVMPVFNGEKYLKDAIDSILNQTFSNFEFLIINDGSTDKSETIIKSYDDRRIRLISHDENLGLIYSLNEGLIKSKADLVVRMDADDWAFPNRLSTQYNYLVSHPDIDVAGSYFEGIDSKKVFKVLLKHDEIRTGMLFNSEMAHPTIILRRIKFLENNFLFDPLFKHAEDYELWIRASSKIKFSNIPEVLLSYRTHPNQVSYKHNLVQLELMFKCQLMQLQKLGIDVTSNDTELHYSILKLDYIVDRNYLLRVLNWFKKISNANLISNYFDQKSLDLTLYKKWMSISGHLLRYNCKAGIIMYKNHFNVSQIVYLNTISFYFIKSLMLFKIAAKSK